jgi:hypothetical protein
VLCPSNIGSFPPAVASGFQLKNGACTNNKVGSFSGAALATQSLTELSQSTTQETARSTVSSITDRRDREEQRCADGFSRVDGICSRNPSVAEETLPTISPERRQRRERALKKTKKAKIVEAPRKQTPLKPRLVLPVPPPSPPQPPVPVEPAVRFGTWGQVYGDYERRDATGPASVFCCQVAGISSPTPIELNVQSRTGAVGFQVAADATSRGLLARDDGVIAGVLIGYVHSNLTLNTASYSSNFNEVGNEFANLHATLSGPTTGLYATYFNGGFSTDFLLKADILSLDETFSDTLAFCVPCFGAGAHVPFSGSGSVSLVNTTVTDNLNYRFDLYPNFWIEPTVGAQYTNLNYGAGGRQLGLADGSVVMVQGGARLGANFSWNNVRITTSLTGLAYDDVLVAGGFIPGAGFQANNLLAQADQGQVRGRGVLAFNFDFGQGINSFVQGEVRGGTGLFGAGGKAGIRYQW